MCAQRRLRSARLIRVFAVRMNQHWVLNYLLSAQGRLWSDWADAQADLRLRWAHRTFCWVCHAQAHIVKKVKSFLLYYYFYYYQVLSLLGKRGYGGVGDSWSNWVGHWSQLKLIYSNEVHNTVIMEHQTHASLQREHKLNVTVSG